MVVFKCKICGGNLEVSEGSSIAVCEYCNTKQTLPTTNDNQIINLYDRANYLLSKCEFDRAESIYENILNLDNTQSEAHWGMILCKYGVEYVEDSCSNERVPTCHRTQRDSILTDPEFELVLKFSDSASKTVYQFEAERINSILKKILEIVKKEKPYDVFICYKRTMSDGSGNRIRTRDSIDAAEIYRELSKEGLRVFFAEVSLDNILGKEYEPYIYAALTTAKVMLVVGSKKEFFNSKWVRNEWSRFIHQMEEKPDQKRYLIPCIRNMDEYDLPDELSTFPHILDISDLGFMPDLIRNIKKIVGKDSAILTNNSSDDQTIPPLLKRAFRYIEERNVSRANELLEMVLDVDSDNAKAQIGKLLLRLNLQHEKDLASVNNLTDITLYQRACDSADDEYKDILLSYREGQYQYAKQILNRNEYHKAAVEFRKIADYKDSSQLYEKAVTEDNKQTYNHGIEEMNRGNYDIALSIFRNLDPAVNTDDIINKCLELKVQKQQLDDEKHSSDIYDEGIRFAQQEKYELAVSNFKSIKGYKDADNLVIKYTKIIEDKLRGLQENEELAGKARIQKIYDEGKAYIRKGEYEQAIAKFSQILDYKDSRQLVDTAKKLQKEKIRQENKAYSARKWFVIVPIVIILIGLVLVGIYYGPSVIDNFTKPKLCSVAFDTGDYIIPSSSITVGSKISNPPSLQNRPGYIFDGWYTASGKRWNFNTDVVSEDTILYAKWVKSNSFSYGSTNPFDFAPTGK